MNHWLEHFRKVYYKNLDAPFKIKKHFKNNIYKRSKGYLLIFENLLELKEKNFNIVETGTCRKKSWTDGMSTVMFADLVDSLGGTVNSVDIDPNAISMAEKIVKSTKVNLHCCDSVEYLKKLENKDKIDLFFLDSYDVKWKNDTPSAEHHLQEFIAIEHSLKNCIVAIDDNTFNTKNKTRTGKGRMIYDYLYTKGITPIYDDYILIYKFT